MAQKKVEQIKHSLELDERLDLHRKGWIIQRVGWGMIFLIMLAGALGVMGDGLFSKVTVQKENAQVEFQRFFRYEAEMPILFTVRGVHAPSVISLPESYIKKFRLVRIIPEPQEYYLKDGYVSYIFNSASDFQATFFVRPESPGSVKGTVRVNNTPVSLQHLIYP